MSNIKNAAVKARMTVDELNAMPTFDSINELVELSEEQLSHIRGGAKGGDVGKPGEDGESHELGGITGWLVKLFIG
ncbi:MAG: hypothetical protein KME30_08100 [Iphinoe sp. HA4291-MV1]|jgi:hypothetical protein|nr:hypothetical protein [Iphinoe sp. HA4291-MV1]